ncbi:MAG TPA: glycosyltransferase family 4 protein [Gaiellaceae bacterium]|nr:glycosyltransferase family 4 protein [Gaiellaceae bacterium]
MTATPLRIALLAPPWFPVPPPGYGGIESVVALLADGLVDAGHDVTLFAAGDSRTKARLRAVYPTAPSDQIGDLNVQLRHALQCVERAGAFDLVHDHTGLLGLTLGGIVPTPLVHTVHGPLDGEPGDLYEQLCRLLPVPMLISISRNQQRQRPSLPWLANCPNAIDFAAYPFEPRRGDYLLFLGRLSADKGAHRAVEVALETGLPLKIAGKKREPLEQAYFEQFIRPHLSDRIDYVGEVSHGEKVELLQGARATLFPIEWEEPFGLVMIESMACGTPVIANRRGAVPEIVEHGLTGLIVPDHRQMVAALEQADRLDPAVIRRRAEQRFRPARMIADHLDAYHAALAHARATRPAAQPELAVARG